MKNSIGIRQQIAAATTVAEVQQLVAEAQTYKEIHPATLRRIQRTAVKRLKEISDEIANKNTKKGNK
jgi:hypothetical protein